MSGPPGAQNFHVWQQQTTSLVNTAQSRAKKADKTAAKFEKDYRRAVSLGDRAQAIKIQKQMDKATKESIKHSKEAKRLAKQGKKKSWWN